MYHFAATPITWTPTAFREGVNRVIALAGRQRTALTCAEAVWWQCHRALIADYLKVRGHAVLLLLS